MFHERDVIFQIRPKGQLGNLTSRKLGYLGSVMLVKRGLDNYNYLTILPSRAIPSIVNNKQIWIRQSFTHYKTMFIKLETIKGTVTFCKRTF